MDTVNGGSKTFTHCRKQHIESVSEGFCFVWLYSQIEIRFVRSKHWRMHSPAPACQPNSKQPVRTAPFRVMGLRLWCCSICAAACAFAVLRFTAKVEQAGVIVIICFCCRRSLSYQRRQPL